MTTWLPLGCANESDDNKGSSWPVKTVASHPSSRWVSIMTIRFKAISDVIWSKWLLTSDMKFTGALWYQCQLTIILCFYFWGNIKRARKKNWDPLVQWAIESSFFIVILYLSFGQVGNSLRKQTDFPPLALCCWNIFQQRKATGRKSVCFRRLVGKNWRNKCVVSLVQKDVQMNYVL